MSEAAVISNGQESFTWLSTSLSVVSDAVIGVNALGVIEFLNPVAETLLGSSSVIVRGRAASEVIRLYQQGTGRALSNPLAESLRLQAPVKAPPSSCLRGSGGREILVEGTAEPVRSPGGELLGSVFVFRDLAAQRQLEERMRQAQKSEVIGQLRAGIAHDFNNLMTIIIGFSDLLLSKTGKDASHSDSRESLLEVKGAAEKATLLTQQILALGRSQVLQMAVVDLNELVKNLEKTLGRVLGEKIRLKTQLDAKVPLVMADTVKIQEALLHLTVNATEAMPRGGDVLIRTRRLETEGTGKDARPELKAELSVSDSGTGMDEETLSRALEPHFTTKPGASGMGLPAVEGIARQFGGALQLESKPGQGVKAALTLPASAAQPRVTTKASPAPAKADAHEAILLVEDADRVRRLLARVLGEAGYTVFEANNGKAGLELCKQLEGKIQLIVTDVIMPEMSGPELIRAISNMKQQPRVLFLSGHTGDELERQGIKQNDYHFLQKPFLGEALLQKVREVLGEEK